MAKGHSKNKNRASKRIRGYGIVGDKAAPLSREGRDQERVENQAPLSNEGRIAFGSFWYRSRVIEPEESSGLWQ